MIRTSFQSLLLHDSRYRNIWCNDLNSRFSPPERLIPFVQSPVIYGTISIPGIKRNRIKVSIRVGNAYGITLEELWDNTRIITEWSMRGNMVLCFSFFNTQYPCVAPTEAYDEPPGIQADSGGYQVNLIPRPLCTWSVIRRNEIVCAPPGNTVHSAARFPLPYRSVHWLNFSKFAERLCSNQQPVPRQLRIFIEESCLSIPPPRA